MSQRVPPVGGVHGVAGSHGVGDGAAAPLEARVLVVRRSRAGRNARPPQDRRHPRPEPPDPAGSKVLMLLVPDGTRLPADLDSGAWRVFLRLSRR